MIPEQELKKLTTKYSKEYNKLIKEFKETYPERLKAMRLGNDPNNKNIKFKLTQNDIGKLTDMFSQWYNKIEKGSVAGGNDLTLAQAIKFSVVFGCSINYLLFGREDPQAASESELREIIRQKDVIIESEQKINAILQEKISKLQKS